MWAAVWPRFCTQFRPEGWCQARKSARSAQHYAHRGHHLRSTRSRINHPHRRLVSSTIELCTKMFVTIYFHLWPFPHEKQESANWSSQGDMQFCRLSGSIKVWNLIHFMKWVHSWNRWIRSFPARNQIHPNWSTLVFTSMECSWTWLIDTNQINLLNFFQLRWKCFTSNLHVTSDVTEKPRSICVTRRHQTLKRILKSISLKNFHGQSCKLVAVSWTWFQFHVQV